jgi:murein DD-endopeptidase MepM/ murein hydrolase activator NlpD
MMNLGTALVNTGVNLAGLNQGLAGAERVATQSASRLDKILSGAAFTGLSQGSNSASTAMLGTALAAGKLSTGFGAVNSQMNQVTIGVTKLAAGFAAAQLGVAATQVALGSMQRGLIGFNATLQDSAVSWEVFLGSATQAQQKLNEISNFAIKSPFNFEQVDKGARVLQVLSNGVLATTENMRILADVAAGTGERFDELAVWFGRAFSSIQAGRPWGEAAMRLQEIGALSAEGRNRLEAMTAAGVSSTQVWNTLIQEFQRFDGISARTAENFRGRLESIRDLLMVRTAQSFKPFFDGISEGMGQVIRILQSPAFEQFSNRIASASTMAIGVVRAIIQDFAAQDYQGVLNNFVAGIQFGLLRANRLYVEFFQNIARLIGQFTGFNPLEGVFNAWLSQIDAGLSRLGSRIEVAGADIAPAIEKTMTGAAGSASSSVNSSMEILGREAVDSIARGMNSTGLDVFDSLVGHLNASFEAINLPDLQEAFAIQGATANLAQISQAIGETGTITDQTKQSILGLNTVIPGLGNDVLALATDLANLAGAKGAVEAAAGSLATAETNLADVMARTGSAVKAAQAAVDSAQRTAQNNSRAFEDMLEPLQDRLDSVQEAAEMAEQAWDVTIDAIDAELDTVNRAAQSSKDYWEGIIGGLEARLEGIENAGERAGARWDRTLDRLDQQLEGITATAERNEQAFENMISPLEDSLESLNDAADVRSGMYRAILEDNVDLYLQEIGYQHEITDAIRAKWEEEITGRVRVATAMDKDVQRAEAQERRQLLAIEEQIAAARASGADDSVIKGLEDQQKAIRDGSKEQLELLRLRAQVAQDELKERTDAMEEEASREEAVAKGQQRTIQQQIDALKEQQEAQKEADQASIEAIKQQISSTKQRAEADEARYKRQAEAMERQIKAAEASEDAEQKRFEAQEKRLEARKEAAEAERDAEQKRFDAEEKSVNKQIEAIERRKKIVEREDRDRVQAAQDNLKAVQEGATAEQESARARVDAARTAKTEADKEYDRRKDIVTLHERQLDLQTKYKQQTAELVELYEKIYGKPGQAGRDTTVGPQQYLPGEEPTSTTTPTAPSQRPARTDIFGNPLPASGPGGLLGALLPPIPLSGPLGQLINTFTRLFNSGSSPIVTIVNKLQDIFSTGAAGLFGAAGSTVTNFWDWLAPKIGIPTSDQKAPLTASAFDQSQFSDVNYYIPSQEDQEGWRGVLQDFQDFFANPAAFMATSDNQQVQNVRGIVVGMKYLFDTATEENAATIAEVFFRLLTGDELTRLLPIYGRVQTPTAPESPSGTGITAQDGVFFPSPPPEMSEYEEMLVRIDELVQSIKDAQPIIEAALGTVAIVSVRLIPAFTGLTEFFRLTLPNALKGTQTRIIDIRQHFDDFGRPMSFIRTEMEKTSVGMARVSTVFDLTGKKLGSIVQDWDNIAINSQALGKVRNNIDLVTRTINTRMREVEIEGPKGKKIVQAAIAWDKVFQDFFKFVGNSIVSGFKRIGDVWTSSAERFSRSVAAFQGAGTAAVGDAAASAARTVDRITYAGFPALQRTRPINPERPWAFDPRRKSDELREALTNRGFDLSRPGPTVIEQETLTAAQRAAQEYFATTNKTAAGTTATPLPTARRPLSVEEQVLELARIRNITPEQARRHIGAFPGGILGEQSRIPAVLGGKQYAPDLGMPRGPEVPQMQTTTRRIEMMQEQLRKQLGFLDQMVKEGRQGTKQYDQLVTLTETLASKIEDAQILAASTLERTNRRMMDEFVKNTDEAYRRSLATQGQIIKEIADQGLADEINIAIAKIRDDLPGVAAAIDKLDKSQRDIGERWIVALASGDEKTIASVGKLAQEFLGSPTQKAFAEYPGLRGRFAGTPESRYGASILQGETNPVRVREAAAGLDEAARARVERVIKEYVEGFARSGVVAAPKMESEIVRIMRENPIGSKFTDEVRKAASIFMKMDFSQLPEFRANPQIASEVRKQLFEFGNTVDETRTRIMGMSQRELIKNLKDITGERFTSTTSKTDLRTRLFGIVDEMYAAAAEVASKADIVALGGLDEISQGDFAKVFSDLGPDVDIEQAARMFRSAQGQALSFDELDLRERVRLEGMTKPTGERLLTDADIESILAAQAKRRSSMFAPGAGEAMAQRTYTNRLASGAFAEGGGDLGIAAQRFPWMEATEQEYQALNDRVASIFKTRNERIMTEALQHRDDLRAVLGFDVLEQLQGIPQGGPAGRPLRGIFDKPITAIDIETALPWVEGPGGFREPMTSEEARLIQMRGGGNQWRPTQLAGRNLITGEVFNEYLTPGPNMQFPRGLAERYRTEQMNLGGRDIFAPLGPNWQDKEKAQDLRKLIDDLFGTNNQPGELGLPRFGDVIDRYMDFLGVGDEATKTLLGANIQGFDIDALQTAMREAGRTTQAYVLGTADLIDTQNLALGILEDAATKGKFTNEGVARLFKRITTELGDLHNAANDIILSELNFWDEYAILRREGIVTMEGLEHLQTLGAERFKSARSRLGEGVVNLSPSERQAQMLMTEGIAYRPDFAGARAAQGIMPVGPDFADIPLYRSGFPSVGPATSIQDEFTRNLSRLTLQIQRNEARLAELATLPGPTEGIRNAVEARLQTLYERFDKLTIDANNRGIQIASSLDDLTTVIDDIDLPGTTRTLADVGLQTKPVGMGFNLPSGRLDNYFEGWYPSTDMPRPQTFYAERTIPFRIPSPGSQMGGGGGYQPPRPPAPPSYGPLGPGDRDRFVPTVRSEARQQQLFDIERTGQLPTRAPDITLFQALRTRVGEIADSIRGMLGRGIVTLNESLSEFDLRIMRAFNAFTGSSSDVVSDFTELYIKHWQTVAAAVDVDAPVVALQKEADDIAATLLEGSKLRQRLSLFQARLAKTFADKAKQMNIANFDDPEKYYQAMQDLEPEVTRFNAARANIQSMPEYVSRTRDEQLRARLAEIRDVDLPAAKTARTAISGVDANIYELQGRARELGLTSAVGALDETGARVAPTLAGTANVTGDTAQAMLDAMRGVTFLQSGFGRILNEVLFNGQQIGDMSRSAGQVLRELIPNMVRDITATPRILREQFSIFADLVKRTQGGMDVMIEGVAQRVPGVRVSPLANRQGLERVTGARGVDTSVLGAVPAERLAGALPEAIRPVDEVADAAAALRRAERARVLMQNGNEMFAGLARVFRNLDDVVKSFSRPFAAVVDRFPILQRVLAPILPAFERLGRLLLPADSGLARIAGHFATLARRLPVMGPIMTQLGRVFTGLAGGALWPLTVVINAIILAVQNWGTIWDRIKNTASFVGDTFKTLLLPVLERFAELIPRIGKLIMMFLIALGAVDWVIMRIIEVIARLIDRMGPVLGPALQIVTGLFAGVAIVIADVLAILLDIVTFNWGALGEDFRKLGDDASKYFNVVKQAIEDFIKGIPVVLDRIFTDVGNWARKLGEQALAAFNEHVLPKIKYFFNDVLIPGIVDFFTTSRWSVLLPIGMLVGIFTGMFSGTDTALYKMLDDLKNGIVTKFNEIKDAIAKWVEDNRDILDPIAVAAGGAAVGAAGFTIAPAAATGLLTVMSSLSTAYSTVKTIITELPGMIAGLPDTITTGLIKTAENAWTAWDNLKKKIGEVFDTMKTGAGNAATGATAKLNAGADAVITKIRGQWENLQELHDELQKKMSNIKVKLNPEGGADQRFISALFGGMGAAIGQGLTNLLGPAVMVAMKGILRKGLLVAVLTLGGGTGGIAAAIGGAITAIFGSPVVIAALGVAAWSLMAYFARKLAYEADKEDFWRGLGIVVGRIGRWLGQKIFDGMAAANNIIAGSIEKIGRALEGRWRDTIEVVVKTIALIPAAVPTLITSILVVFGSQFATLMKNLIIIVNDTIMAIIRVAIFDTVVGIARVIRESFATLREQGFVAALRHLFGGLGDVLGESLGKIGDILGEGIGRAKGAIGDFFSGVWEGMKAGWAKFTGMFSGADIDFAAPFRAIINGLKGFWNGLVQTMFGENLDTGPWRESVVRLMNAIERTFRDWKTEGVFEIPIIGGILRAFQWLYDQLVGHSIVPDLVNKIKEWWDKLSTWAQEVFGFIVNWIFQKLDELSGGALGKIIHWVQNAIDWFNKFKEDPKAAIDEMVANIVAKVDELNIGPIETIKGWYNTAMEWFNKFKEDPKAAIQELVDGVLEKLGDLSTKAEDKVKEVWKQAMAWFQKLTTEGETETGTLRDKVVAVLSDLMTKGIAVFKDAAWEAIKDAITAPFRNAKLELELIVGSLAGVVANAFNDIIGVIESFINSFKDAINWIGDKLGIKAIITGEINLPRILGVGASSGNGGGSGEAVNGPMLNATGTKDFPGGWSWVGEKGPELMKLPPGVAIAPHGLSKLLAAEAGIPVPGTASTPGIPAPKGQMQVASSYGFPGFAEGINIPDIVNAIRSGVGAVREFVSEWRDKGASKLVDFALNTVGLKAPEINPDFALSQIPEALFNKVKQRLIIAATNWLRGGRGGLGGTVTGSGEYAFPVAGPNSFAFPHWDGSTSSVDIMAAEGTPIVAMKGGRVSHAGIFPLGGNTVTIQGVDNLAFYYAHMMEPAMVSAGQAVDTGQQIGLVGRTGNAYKDGAGDPHLHLGVGPEITGGGDGGAFDLGPILNAASTGEILYGEIAPDLSDLDVDLSGTVLDWLQQAINITGVPQYWLDGLAIIAKYESGGDPSAINLWDSNAAAGNPSKGLMQVIQDHFLPGEDPFNPVHNAVAAIRYILSRYKDIYNVPGVASIMAGGGYKPYAEGGLVTNPVVGIDTVTGDLISIAENGPEYIIPEDRTLRKETWQYIGNPFPGRMYWSVADDEGRAAPPTSPGPIIPNVTAPSPGQLNAAAQITMARTTGKYYPGELDENDPAIVSAIREFERYNQGIYNTGDEPGGSAPPGTPRAPKPDKKPAGAPAGEEGKPGEGEAGDGASEDPIQRMVDAIAAGTQALTDMIGTPVIHQGTVDRFVNSYSLAVSGVARVNQIVGEEGIASASALATSSESIFNMISTSVEAMKSIVGSELPSAGEIDKLIFLTQYLINGLTAMSTSFGEEGTAAASALATAAGEMLPNVQGVAEALMAITAADQYPSTRQIDGLIFSMMHFIARLSVAATEMTTEGIAQATALAASTEVIFSVIVPALEALKALSDPSIFPSDEQIAAFGDRLLKVVQRIHEISTYFDVIGLEQTRHFAEQTKEIFSVIDVVVKGFAALTTMIVPSDEHLVALGDRLLKTVKRMHEISTYFDVTGLEQTRHFGEQTKEIFGVIDVVLAGFKALTEISPPSDDHLTALGDRLLKVIRRFHEISTYFDVDMLRQTVHFVEEAVKIFNAIKPLMEGMKALAGIEAPSDEQLANLLETISKFVATVRGAEALPEAGVVGSAPVIAVDPNAGNKETAPGPPDTSQAAREWWAAYTAQLLLEGVDKAYAHQMQRKEIHFKFQLEQETLNGETIVRTLEADPISLEQLTDDVTEIQIRNMSSITTPSPV